MRRKLRVFSFDPLLGTKLDLLGIGVITVSIPWTVTDGDGLRPGPVGEYLEVVDVDPGSGLAYQPVDLNHPYVLAQDGLPPSEGNPQFHQQMVYAVAMSTIRVFEEALGRAALWARRITDERGNFLNDPDREYVPRLRIYPHALRQANAFYDPTAKALLFGYFPAVDRPSTTPSAAPAKPGRGGNAPEANDVSRVNLPGGTVFTCLSYDIVAHETTHALLDGLHRYFGKPSNKDVLAFHEAFADVVALFQHFSDPEVLRHQLARTRGDLGNPSLLAELAQQFGNAIGERGALREYLSQPPDPTILDRVDEAHERGKVLVAAIFRAFLKIYDTRVADLRRIASEGTGILRRGELPPDLVNRLADEAARAAGHVLRMCIRALDYAPPLDLTFGEYLRALITADHHLVPDDDLHYRVAFVDAFRDWGILPRDVRSWSVESLLWRPPDFGPIHGLDDLLEDMEIDIWNRTVNRRELFLRMQRNKARLHDWLKRPEIIEMLDNGRAIGLALGPNAPLGIKRDDRGIPTFEVHSLRPCRRVGPDGQVGTDVIVEVLQRRLAYLDEGVQRAVDEPRPPRGKSKGRAPRAKAEEPPPPDFIFRGGSTIIVNPVDGAVRMTIRKRIDDAARLERERRFQKAGASATDQALYASPSSRRAFAFLHGGQ